MSGRRVIPPRDMALYERLIGQGIAAADRRGRAIDHVTARRLAIWLVPRSREEPEFMRGLITFGQTGAITEPFRRQLRHHARTATHPNRPHAARLLQYATARQGSLGPIGSDFAEICEQIDSADAMLADLRDRLADGRRLPEPARPDPATQHPIALARYDPASRTYGFILDATTANAAIHAITLSAFEHEAHTREVERTRQDYPKDSYGRRNRETIAGQEARTAARLRAVEHAYQIARDPDTTRALDLTRTLPRTDKIPDREPEPE